MEGAQMRPEALVGVFTGIVVVGYFTSTSPTIAMSLVLGSIFIAFSVQILRAARSNRMSTTTAPMERQHGRSRTRMKVLADLALVFAISQTAWSAASLLIAHNGFSTFGVLCGACFVGAAHHMRSVLSQQGYFSSTGRVGQVAPRLTQHPGGNQQERWRP